MPSTPWWVRFESGWKQVGTGTRPINLFLPSKKWMLFGDGGGVPLFIRDKNNKWIQVSTEGSNIGTIFGQVSEFNSGIPLVNKLIRVYDASSGQFFQTRTDARGNYRITGLPVHQLLVQAYRIAYYDYNQVYATLDRDNPVYMLNFFFGDGITKDNYTFANVFGYDRFLGPVGWTAQQVTNMGILSPWGGPTNNDVVTTEQDAPSSGLNAGVVSSTGWIGDSESTQTREKIETVGWYSIPVGMLKEIEDTSILLYQINNHGAHTEHWTLNNPQLVEVEVIVHLSGYSVEKSQKPWMNFYYQPSTTIGPWGGVGALRFQGLTSDTSQIVVNHGNEVAFSGNVPALPYVVDVPYNHTFAREDGEIWWTGDLNSLGTGVHGFNRPEVTFSKIFDATAVDYSTSLQLHMQVSDLPDPTPFENGDHTWDNEMSAWFEVNFYYHFY